jgi:hypothetical protein
MLAPEGFLQLVQSIRLAEADIGEIPPVELSQQAPCPGALQTLPEAFE